jgi:hypothetical protein
MTVTDTPVDVWVAEDPHLMWLETRQDGQAQRVRCLTCGPLYARELAETRNGALGMDRVRHRAHAARAATQEVPE